MRYPIAPVLLDEWVVDNLRSLFQILPLLFHPPGFPWRHSGTGTIKALAPLAAGTDKQFAEFKFHASTSISTVIVTTSLHGMQYPVPGDTLVGIPFRT